MNREWFGEAIAARNMSQRQLARRMGVDPASVHRLFTGKRPMRLDEAATLSRLLRVPVVDVLWNAGLDVGLGSGHPIVGFIDSHGEIRLFVRRGH